MSLSKCTECGHQLSNKADKCPQCGAPQSSGMRYVVWIVAGLIGAFVGSWVIDEVNDRSGASYVTRSTPDSSSGSGSYTRSSAPPLLLLSSSCGVETSTYMHSRGQVKNMTSQPIKNIEAIAEYYTKDGTFIISDDAFVEFNPLMPGQTTPYHVLLPGNPLIAKCSIRFKVMWGEELAYKTPASQNKRKPGGALSTDASKDMIRQVQTLLGQLGYVTGGIDGAFGKKTQSAIMKYQEIRSMPQDGKVTQLLISGMETQLILQRLSSN